MKNSAYYYCYRRVSEDYHSHIEQAAQSLDMSDIEIIDTVTKPKIRAEEQLLRSVIDTLTKVSAVNYVL